jgi:WD40 repeat protein
MTADSKGTTTAREIPTGVMARNRAKLDAENPWPGLDAYGEDSKGYFKGRETEAAELLRLIRLSPLTVVYGKSGLGKTSLLEAGLFPLLRDEHYLPVYLRLDFSGGLREPLGQAMQGLMDALKCAGADYPEAAAGQSLWEYLHGKKPEIWSADNYPLTPVLVFDQFEELFSRSGGNANLITQVFDDLADLIENRIPAEIAAETAAERRSALDLFAQHYRVVLSFREDFLPEIRAWEKQVPSLLKSSLRLGPLSRSSAIKAVEETGKAVLAEGIAEQIVDFVGKRDDATASTGTSEIVIEPVLLSLCCTQLNRGRKPGGKIDQALLKGAGESILDKFYKDALDDNDVQGLPDVALFVEDRLIQGGFRGDYPKQEALDEGKLTEKQLSALTDRLRLLRIVSHADTPRIELIHDRLVPVIGKAREERLQRELQQEQERKVWAAESERRKEQERSEELSKSLRAAKRNRNIATGAFVASFLVLLWGAHEWSTKERMKRGSAVAMDTARLAEGGLALGAGAEPLEQTMYRGLAAYRLTENGKEMSQAKVASLTALHWVLESTSHLRKAVTLRSLVPTPALSYSPDDKNIIAVGGEDGLIRLLDGGTYEQLDQPLDCHAPAGEAVWSLSFNSNGKRLAAGYARNSGADGSSLVCVFDVAQRSVVRRWPGGKPANVYSVAYGGKEGQEFVVSGGSNNRVRLLDVHTGEEHVSPVQKDAVVAVAVSADGRLVAAGGEDTVLRIWNVDDLRSSNAKPRNELRGHGSTIQQVEFSPAEPTKVVSAGDDGRIFVWNVERACRVQESATQENKIYNIDVNPDGELLATAGADGNVRLFRLTKGDLPCIEEETKGVRPKTASARTHIPISSPTLPRTVARAHPPTIVPAVPPVTPTQKIAVIEDGVLAGHGGLVLAVAWNAKGDRLASTGQEGSIRIWGVANTGFSIARLIFTETTPGSPATGTPTKVAISPDGRSIAAGDNQGLLRIWNTPARSVDPVANYEAFPAWSGHEGAVSALMYMKMGEQVVLISGGEDGHLKRWETNGKLIAPDMTDDAGPIRSIAVSPDGKSIAAGSSDGTVRLWDAATGARKERLEPSGGGADPYVLYAVAFTSDGKYLATGDASFKSVLIRDLAKKGSERILVGHNDKVTALSRSGDKWLLSAGPDGSVLEWEASAPSRPKAEGLKKEDEFRYRMGFRDLASISSLDASADGSLIATGGGDKAVGRVQLWDGSEHVRIGTSLLAPRSGDVGSVAIAPDASFFVTADRQEILVWPGPSQWADLICSKLVWNMSQKQWREWVSPLIPYQDQCSGMKVAAD